MYRWQNEAESKGTTSYLFFPSRKLPADEKYRIEQIAKKICTSCVVQEECLEYAVANPALIAEGIWGGETFKQIKKIRRQRSRNDATNMGC